MPASAVKDEAPLVSLNKEEKALFLAEKTPLLFNVNPDDAPDALRKFIQYPRSNPLGGG